MKDKLSATQTSLAVLQREVEAWTKAFKHPHDNSPLHDLWSRMADLHQAAHHGHRARVAESIPEMIVLLCRLATDYELDIAKDTARVWRRKKGWFVLNDPDGIHKKPVVNYER